MQGDAAFHPRGSDLLDVGRGFAATCPVLEEHHRERAPAFTGQQQPSRDPVPAARELDGLLAQIDGSARRAGGFDAGDGTPPEPQRLAAPAFTPGCGSVRGRHGLEL